MTPEDGPQEREPTLARRSPFAPATKLCPKCLSPLETGHPTPGPYNPLGGLWGIVPAMYECPKCGYAGTVFLEKQPDAGTEKR